jgi:hypothetical protein
MPVEKPTRGLKAISKPKLSETAHDVGEMESLTAAQL